MILESAFLIPCVTIIMLGIMVLIAVLIWAKRAKYYPSHVINNYDEKTIHEEFYNTPDFIKIKNEIIRTDVIQRVILNQLTNNITVIFIDADDEDIKQFYIPDDDEFDAVAKYLSITLKVSDSPNVEELNDDSDNN